MQSPAATPQEYMENLPEDRKEAMNTLREVINKNLPKGFQEQMNYGMLGWVVPHSAYPDGYHCDPKQPLPFLALASQKNFIAVYTMSLYADKDIHDWFVAEFANRSKYKLDMGKSCIRFKKPDAIPFELIGQLVAKMTLEQWIALYEKNLKS